MQWLPLHGRQGGPKRADAGRQVAEIARCRVTGRTHEPLFDLGIDGTWPDQGDGLDEPSRIARIRMHWEGPQRSRPNERPFALHRNGAPGMQRYGAFLWSGDVYSFWETLKTHVPVAVNTGLSGIPYSGTDIGGFVPTADYTGELHVRWFQFGTFCPSFRAHGRNWHLRLPWGWNMGRSAPSELRGYTGGAADPDPNELNNPRVEPIVKKYLELRYRLLPYTYTCRSRVLRHRPADDARAVAAPCERSASGGARRSVPGTRSAGLAWWSRRALFRRRLYLPHGTWFDFWTEDRVEARTRDRSRSRSSKPCRCTSARGAIIPMGPIKQYASMSRSTRR